MNAPTAALRGHPAPWWECPACQIPVDADRVTCPKCGAARSRACREPGCERTPRAEFAYCGEHTAALLSRAMAGEAVR